MQFTEAPKTGVEVSALTLLRVRLDDGLTQHIGEKECNSRTGGGLFS